jgi:DNA-binding response OmpR family regulator
MYLLYVVEDDTTLRELLTEALARYGYAVRAATGDAFTRIAAEVEAIKPHLILLDVNLPVYDGFHWARRIRMVSKAPILFISVRGEPLDQVRALEQGGDDYVVKPFHLEVLLAKVEALLRRAYGELADASEALVTYAGLRVDRGRGELVYGERRVALTPTELRLVTRLIQARGKPVSREDLLIVAWSDETFVDDNTLTVNIARLRRKLAELGLAEAPGGPAQPEAVR